MGTDTTHPGSTHPPSHHSIIPPGAPWTAFIRALPTLQRYRNCRSGCDRTRKRGQRCSLLHHWGLLSPRAEALGRTTCACAFCHVPRTGVDSPMRRLQISATPIDPNTRPPSYSLLGVLILVRLGHRLLSHLRSRPSQSAPSISDEKRPEYDTPDGPHLDDRPVTTLLNYDPEADLELSDRKEQPTVIDFESVPASVRAGRMCTLCLEERTATCVTECGHLFDWNCIYNWGREKVRHRLAFVKFLRQASCRPSVHFAASP